MRTLQSELIDKGYAKPKKERPHKRKINRKRKTQPHPTNTKTENMSKHDWEEIMGIRRPRYRRSRGAFRQL